MFHILKILRISLSVSVSYCVSIYISKYCIKNVNIVLKYKKKIVKFEWMRLNKKREKEKEKEKERE